MLRRVLILAALAAALAMVVQASGGERGRGLRSRRVGALPPPHPAANCPPQGRVLAQEGDALVAMTGTMAPLPLADLAPGPAPALAPAMADG